LPHFLAEANHGPAFFAYATADGMSDGSVNGQWEIITELVFPMIRSLTFSNGSKYIALACDDSTVYVVEIPSWSVAAKDPWCSVLPLSLARTTRDYAWFRHGILSLIDPLGGWEAGRD
jgi:hypothetical protein